MSQSTNIETPWSTWHNRLHKSLKMKKDLLPAGSCLLLAISGGQDSMALLKLIADLQRLYEWEIHIWHGNHGWHKESQTTAKELEFWCQKQGFNFEFESASKNLVNTEEAARNWRYEKLLKKAKVLFGRKSNSPCQHVLTGHTATDQTETLIMNLARGAYLGGLSSLKSSRKLEENIELIRPLVIFSRKETLDICKSFNLPIWVDPSNKDLKFHRNRIRHEIMPILEEMYPGSTQRIASLTERLSHIKNNQDTLIDLSLGKLKEQNSLCREVLASLPNQTKLIILAKWLADSGAPTVKASVLEEVSNMIRKDSDPGVKSLSKGWQLTWDKELIKIIKPI